MRSELSSNNPYYLSAHRTLELVHFCKQYSEWVAQKNALTYLRSVPVIDVGETTRNISDPTSIIAEQEAYYDDRIKMVSDTCYQTDPVLGKYIFLSVTKGYSYSELNAMFDVPCGEQLFYKKRREFLWRLSEARK